MAVATADQAPSARPLNILIVDDSAMMRAMIKRVASLCNVAIGSIYEAGNGLEAIRVLETHPVDCLLTDLNMPMMTGTELLRQIEKRQDWRRLTRVIVSTDGSAARRQEVRDLNVRLYVEKPFRPEVMRDILTEIAASARVR